MTKQKKQAAVTETVAATEAMVTAKKTAKPKAKARTADEIMPKARASDALVVFAIRCTPEERDLIHATAGPARASRFVRAIALAAARRDVAALQAIMLEAQRDAVTS